MSNPKKDCIRLRWPKGKAYVKVDRFIYTRDLEAQKDPYEFDEFAPKIGTNLDKWKAAGFEVVAPAGAVPKRAEVSAGSEAK